MIFIASFTVFVASFFYVLKCSVRATKSIMTTLKAMILALLMVGSISAMIMQASCATDVAFTRELIRKLGIISGLLFVLTAIYAAIEIIARAPRKRQRTKRNRTKMPARAVPRAQSSTIISGLTIPSAKRLHIDGEKTINEYKNMVQNNPQDPKPFQLLAEEYYLNDRFEDCIRTYLKILDMEIDEKLFSLVANRIADVYQNQLGDLDSACDCLKKLKQRFPHSKFAKYADERNHENQEISDVQQLNNLI